MRTAKQRVARKGFYVIVPVIDRRDRVEYLLGSLEEPRSSIGTGIQCRERASTSTNDEWDLNMWRSM